MAEAELDIEIAAHLGLFRNIDLLQKGTYAVRLKLNFGDSSTPIVPTGLFSAPSSLGSYVGDQMITPTRFITGCEVSESDLTCTSRSFMVRYRGEIHELNDGAFWRLTLPSVPVPLSEFVTVSVGDMIFLSVELLFAPLTTDIIDVNVLYDTPDIYLPENMTFEVINSQVIALQHLSSGFHEYYGVTFDADNYVALDLMIHGCITAVHYRHVNFLLPAPKPKKESKPVGANSDSVARVDSALLTPVRKARISTKVEGSSATSAQRPSSRKSMSRASQISQGLMTLPKMLFSPEKLLFGDGTKKSKPEPASTSSFADDPSMIKMVPNPITVASLEKRKGEATSSTAAATPDGESVQSAEAEDPDLPEPEVAALCESLLAVTHENPAASTCIISRNRIAEVYDMYSAAVIQNFQVATTRLNQLLAQTKDVTIDDRDDSHQQEEADPCCLLQSHREANIDALQQAAEQAQRNFQAPKTTAVATQSGESSAKKYQLHLLRGMNQTLTVVFQQVLDSCHEDLVLRWSNFTSGLRRRLYSLRALLLPPFQSEVLIFWKQQMISHTRPYHGAHLILSSKDTEMWQILATHVTVEREHEREKLQEGNQYILNARNRGRYARGLRCFDWRTLRLPSRLPYLLVERYSLREDGDGDGNPETPPRVPRKEQSTNATAREKSLMQSPFPSSYKEFTSPSSNDEGRPFSSDANPMIERTHVIILQHGFLGSSFDMRQMAHALQIWLAPTETPATKRQAPSAVVTADGNVRYRFLVHCCISNEGTPNTTQGIREMGQRFAQEVYEFLDTKVPSLLAPSTTNSRLPSAPDRISFIGHSLGGLIIRSGLQESILAPLHKRLHLFMSLASPHVGNLYSDSSLVSTGMWALARFRNYRCLQELVLEDAVKDINGTGGNSPVPPATSTNGKKRDLASLSPAQLTDVLRQNCVLYRLAQPLIQISEEAKPNAFTAQKRVIPNVLGLFQHVVLVSSPKDQYVSTYSARIQISPKLEQDSQKEGSLGSILVQMIDSLTQEVLRPEQLTRVTIVNNEEEISIASTFANAKATDAGTPSVNGVHTSLVSQDMTLLASSTPTTTAAWFAGDVNTAIGRSAHICYLDNATVAEQLIASCRNLFVD